jgi:hypothetical protein
MNDDDTNDEDGTFIHFCNRALTERRKQWFQEDSQDASRFGALRLDTSNDFAEDELVAFRRLLRADMPHDMVGQVANMIRQMINPQRSGREEAMVLLSLLRRCNAPRTEDGGIDYETFPDL